MLRKHKDLWSGRLGNVKITQSRIELIPGARPFKSTLYRAGPKTRRPEIFEIDKELKAGFIEQFVSDWTALVLFALKKDGILRFCVEYRNLKKMKIKDSHTFHRMDECIDSLGEAKVITTLDAYSGYWQVLISPKDTHKTSFV